MPRYYFHLSAPDVSFRDPIGFELSDLSAAHSRALQLADRVMMIGGLASCPPDLRRWTVQITDECQHSVMNVMFSAEFEKRRAADHVDGARALQERLATRMESKNYSSRSKLKPINPVSICLRRQCRRSTFGNPKFDSHRTQLGSDQPKAALPKAAREMH